MGFFVRKIVGPVCKFFGLIEIGEDGVWKKPVKDEYSRREKEFDGPNLIERIQAWILGLYSDCYERKAEKTEYKGESHAILREHYELRQEAKERWDRIVPITNPIDQLSLELYKAEATKLKERNDDIRKDLVKLKETLGEAKKANDELVRYWLDSASRLVVLDPNKNIYLYPNETDKNEDNERIPLNGRGSNPDVGQNQRDTGYL